MRTLIFCLGWVISGIACTGLSRLWGIEWKKTCLLVPFENAARRYRKEAGLSHFQHANPNPENPMMRRANSVYKTLLSLGLCGGLLAPMVPTVWGAGFALQEHSISGLGVGFASGAAGGPDNASMFFNAATLTLHKERQATAGIHFILPEAEFRNEGTATGYFIDDDGNLLSPGVPTQGSEATSDVAAVVPNVYYSQPVGERMVMGLGISVPYGLATSYDEGWVGRYVALETDLATVNANLAIGYEISDTLSIGGGVNVLHGDAVLSNAINFGLLFLNQSLADGPLTPLQEDVQANLGGTKYDGSLRLEGDDMGYGFNLGLLYQPTESTRIGLHYRSSVELTLEGNADFEVGALEAVFGDLFADQGGKVDLELPDTAQVSVHHQVTPQWAVMADVFHTWWSKFDELDIQYELGQLNELLDPIPEKWEDVWRFSVGTSYDVSESLQLRAGLVYDESPVPSDAYRSPRIPDADRTWLTLGLGYQLYENVYLDAAYVHIFVDDPVIDNATHTGGERLVGTMDATVDIVSASVTVTF